MTIRALLAIVALSAVAGAAGWNIGAQHFRAPVVRWEVREVHEFDLSDPWERCLAAVEDARIPGWMWECREFPGQ